MGYDQLINDTDKMIRRIVVQNDIVVITLSTMLAVLTVLLGWWAWKEHQEKMRVLKAQRDQEEWADIRETFGQQDYYRRM